jgi:translocation and assembly module TamA
VQAYWGHRNLFGEGERLKLDATISQIGGEGLEQLQFDAGAVLTKPGILDIDTDLFSELRIVRERPDTYESLGGNVRVGLAHRFDPYLSGSVAIEGTQSRIDDAFGVTNYTLLSLPGELVFDTRNNRLDPSHGVNALAQLDPVAEVSSGAAFGAANVRIASYAPLDADGRFVLAGRVIAGSDFGASLSQTPATYRFYAGGGGSVRGYEYRSLGPTFNGAVVGGLSLIGASAELRARIWERFGIVPFIDVATVSPDSVPSFSDEVYIGAGVGFRYYTSLGPIRIDVAAPTTHTQGQPKFGVYLGLGQAF